MVRLSASFFAAQLWEGSAYMRDYRSISLADARREYLATSTTAMPIAGFIAWSALAVAAYMLGDRLPSFAPFHRGSYPIPAGPRHRQDTRRTRDPVQRQA